MATTRKRYRPRAKLQRLRFDGVLIGCTDTCFAIGADAATAGGLSVNEAQVRALSNEAHPDPASPGLNLAQLVGVARKLHVGFYNRTGESFAQLDHYLDTCAAVVAQVDDPAFAAVPHAIYLHQHVAGTYRGVNPLDGKWHTWPEHDVQRGMVSFARAHIPVGVYFGSFRPTPWLSTDQRPQGPA